MLVLDWISFASLEVVEIPLEVDFDEAGQSVASRLPPRGRRNPTAMLELVLEKQGTSTGPSSMAALEDILAAALVRFKAATNPTHSLTTVWRLKQIG